MKKNTKHINGSDSELHIHPGTQALVDDGYYDDAIELQKFINKVISGEIKRWPPKKRKP